MKHTKHYILSATILPMSLIGSAHAAVIASTDFDLRTVSTNTASNLNWVLNGIDDPGSMSANLNGGGAQNLFDGAGTDSKTIFAPARNYGNNGGSWITTVDIVVSAGNNVTISDVTFDYWAISGSGNQNVTREADFKVTLFNPSATAVGGVFSINDVSNGATPGIGTLVTATFTPVALTAPGTYTLEIESGELGGDDETGNHSGIDNLSINGTVTPIPEPSSFALLGLGALAALGRRCRR
ncbi:MAG: PEP-CTERM sorting domain-containing protein [Akkermansiaceae bacterium]